jgi:hypothetical protein
VASTTNAFANAKRLVACARAERTAIAAAAVATSATVGRIRTARIIKAETVVSRKGYGDR